jgi:hypothetical protein
MSIQNLPDYRENMSLYAIYAHLQNDVSGILIPKISVDAGTPIGTMGATGNTGGFVHLHFELRVGDPGLELNAAYGDWYNANKLAPVDPALIVTPNDTWTGWAVQSKWDSALQCAAGEQFLATQP